ncbi:MAG: hypothetical protein R3F59_30990 [Myxococcota bacterium]
MHLHAAAATAWVALLVVQAALVVGGRLRVHQRLGAAGLAVAAGFAPLTLLAVRAFLTRSDPPGALEQTVFFPQVASLAMFAAFVGAGALLRRRPEAHARLMLLATVALLGTPVARIELFGIRDHPLAVVALWDLPAVLLLAHDVAFRRRLHPATAAGLGVLLALQGVSVALMGNAAWGAVVSEIAARVR